MDTLKLTTKLKTLGFTEDQTQEVLNYLPEFALRVVLFMTEQGKTPTEIIEDKPNLDTIYKENEPFAIDTIAPDDEIKRDYTLSGIKDAPNLLSNKLNTMHDNVIEPTPPPEPTAPLPMVDTEPVTAPEPVAPTPTPAPAPLPMVDTEPAMMTAPAPAPAPTPEPTALFGTETIFAPNNTTTTPPPQPAPVVVAQTPEPEPEKKKSVLGWFGLGGATKRGDLFDELKTLQRLTMKNKKYTNSRKTRRRR